MLKAILFDMDGLMLDTEVLLTRFWCEAAHFYGYDLTPRHCLSLRSLSAKYAVPLLKSWFGDDFDYPAVRAKRIELMNEYIEKNGVETKKGLENILEFAKLHGLKCAVCTATDLKRTTMYLKKANVIDLFDEIVTGEQVGCSKPEPDIYLEGAARLGLDPSECAALEDSPNGIESAYRAGCIPIFVPDLSENDPDSDPEFDKKIFARAQDLDEVCDILKGLLVK